MSTVTRLTPVGDNLEPIDTTEIATITVAAVDEIGTRSADQVDLAADTVEAAGKALAGKLRALATAMREHTRRAAQEVSDFSLLTTTFTDTVRGLEKQLMDKNT